jgi:hypothetical protein
MPHRRGRDLPPPTSDQRLANERARIVQGTPAKLLPQAKQGAHGRGVTNNRRPHPSNAGRKNTGLSRTITITLSARLGREKAAARGKVEKPGVTNVLRPKPFGEVIAKFERCARTSLPPIATIAAARARRTSIRRIAANMFTNPSTAPSAHRADNR